MAAIVRRRRAGVHGSVRSSFLVQGHRVSSLLTAPPDPELALVLAHGAGAGMEHRFMEELAAALASERIATLRYQFPYSEQGKSRPDPPALLEATVRAAVDETSRALPGLPLFAGGKSMGGRMTSRAAAAEPLPSVRGIAFLGFPLHPAGKPGTERADHLARTTLPLLFLQGDRDDLAPLDALTPIVSALGTRARLHVVTGADHGFAVLKRSGRTGAEVLRELASVTRAWMQSYI
jgi:uncharacterized protein